MNENDNGNGKSVLAPILIILALLSAGVLLLYSKRRIIVETLREGIHGSHGHGEDAPETAGRTIQWAGVYDLASNIMMLGKAAAVQDGVVSLAQISAGDQVLDVGCGTGSITLVAARRVGPDGRVFGIDAAPEMIAVARRKAEERGAEVSFEVGLIEKLPFENGRFDSVINSLVLHHLPDSLKEQAFAEFYRVLKPGGRLFAVDFEPPTNRFARGLYGLFLGDGMMLNDVSTLSGLVASAGFEGVKTGPTGFRLLSYLSGLKPLPSEIRESTDSGPG